MFARSQRNVAAGVPACWYGEMAIGTIAATLVDSNTRQARRPARYMVNTNRQARRPARYVRDACGLLVQPITFREALIDLRLLLRFGDEGRDVGVCSVTLKYTEKTF